MAMTQPVIDTLRLADRLKESGFQDTQAEGLARALGSEFTEHLVTKADLDSAIALVEARFNALRTQIKFIFTTLAALLALGLIGTVPRLLG